MAFTKKHDAPKVTPAPVKPPPITDPLEAAKIVHKPDPLPPPPPVIIPPPPPLPAPVVASGDVAKKYRVTATTTISLFGTMTRLNRDDIISAESYGPDVMKRILESNVPMVVV